MVVEMETAQQTDFIYKQVELGSLINKETIREELDPEIGMRTCTES